MRKQWDGADNTKLIMIVCWHTKSLDFKIEKWWLNVILFFKIRTIKVYEQHFFSQFVENNSVYTFLL